MRNKSLMIPFVEVFSKVISFINILLLVRILPIKDYADYSYIVAIVLWSSVLMDGGINSLIYNKSLKNKTGGINLLFTSRFFLSLIVIFILTSFFIIRKPNLAISGLVFSLTIYFSSTSALIKMLSRGMGFVKTDVISIISEPIIRFVFLLIIYISSNYFSYNLDLVLLIYLLASIIAFIVNKNYLNTVFSLNLKFKGFKKALKNVIISLKLSKFYLLYYLLLIGLSRIDILFLESYSTKQDLAVFSSGLNMFLVAQLFFFSIITSQFIKLYKKKNLILKILAPIIVLAIIITNFLSSFIFKYLFPEEYIQGQFVLNILIVALLPSVINFYFITKNNYENKVKANFVLLLLVFLSKLILYFVIKPIDLSIYSYVFLGAEIFLSFFFLAKFFHESITNK